MESPLKYVVRMERVTELPASGKVTKPMPFIAELLNQIETASRTDRIDEFLCWLAGRCNASSICLTANRSMAENHLQLAWPPSDLVHRGNKDDMVDRALRRIELGLIDGEVAFLDLGLPQGALADDVDRSLDSLRQILFLFLQSYVLRLSVGRMQEDASRPQDDGAEGETDGRMHGASIASVGQAGARSLSHGGTTMPLSKSDESAQVIAASAKREPEQGSPQVRKQPDGTQRDDAPTDVTKQEKTKKNPRFGSGAAGRSAKSEAADHEDPAYDRLSAILEVLPDLVFEITAEGRYTDFLAGPTELMGNARQDLPGKTLEDVLPPEIAALTRGALEETLKTGRSAPMRYRLASPVGPRWYECTGARKGSTDTKEDLTVIFVVRDVTDDMQLTEDLGRMGRVVETMTNMVAIVDLDQRITWVNNAWEKRTGWSLAEVSGLELSTLVRGKEAEPTNAELVSEAVARGGVYHGETVNYDRHGTAYWIDFNILPIHDLDGHLVGFVSVETDISRQKASEVRAAQMAEEADRMRSQLYNAIESLPDGVLIWDKDDRLVFANTAYKRMYPEVAEELVMGVSQEDILQMGISLKAFPDAIGREEAWLAEQWARYRNPTVDEVHRQGGRFIRRLDLRTTDGGRIAVRIDTTKSHEQVQALNDANKSLAEARESLAHIIESADVGTWEWRVDTGDLRIGGRYAEMLGYSPEELATTTDDMFRSLVHPDDLKDLDATEDDDFAPLSDGREPVREHQLRMRRKDGSWAWILSRSAVTERDQEGRHVSVVGVHLDVTERKDLEELVFSNQTFLNEVMNASISAIVVMDEQGVITYANAEAEEVLGVKKSTIEGRLYNDPEWRVTTIDGTPMPAEELPYSLARQTGQSVRDIRMAIEWPNGTRRVLSVNVVPHSKTKGGTEDRSFITSFVDITDELNKAARLEQALLEAQAASRSKSIFLATMSHEIRTPLNGVLGMAEMLDGLIDEPRKKEMIGTIRRSGELLLSVLNEILDMSKIEAGKMVIEHIPFTPADIARQIEPLHALHAEEKGLDFETLTNPGAERLRIGDPFRIQQILNNLLSNAIKFTESGSVSLTMSAREDRPLTIEVVDTGIGMSAEHVSRLFNNFEQADGGTTRRFGGTGLGMAIVHNLVNLMGGEVSVWSDLGRGTRVKIVLPLPEAGEIVVAEPVNVDAPRRLSLTGKTLIVADDSMTNRMVIREMLKDTNATIVMATNGAEGVTEWTRLVEEGHPPDMLILDIAMPVLDGIGALQSIRASGDAGARVPAIAVTANAMPHQVSEYIASGFDSHVAKPFRRAELLHAISTLMPSSPSSRN